MYRNLWTTALFSTFALFTTCGEHGQAVVCVPVKQYSAATQKKAAEEYALVKQQFPTVTQYLADYGGMRAAARVCQSGKVS